MTLQSNILVISDLHLGEDLSPSATESTTRHIEVMERQLVQFLRHYARRRRDGRPWRLVINGDMVDFLSICLGSKDDVGRGRRPDVARAKMDAVVDRHGGVFRAMARFAAAGNSIEIITGNHDAEFHFPEVREALCRGVGRMWEEMPGARRNGAPTRQMIEQRIRFQPWFFYEPGVAWIEHGHQYDECSSFDCVLEPVGSSGDEIATNVDVAAMRYVNQLDDAEPHALAEWDFAGYVKWAFGKGLRGLFAVAFGYVVFALSLLRVCARYRPGSRASRRRHEQHRARLREQSASWNLSESNLRAVDTLRRRPVVGSVRRLLNVLMLDRFALHGLAFLGSVAALFALPLGMALLVMPALFLASSLACHYVAGRRIASSDNEAALSVVPERIARQVDARFVVFGHTHEPVVEPLPFGGCYFNTGTWVPAGKPGILRAFTHVIIRVGDRPSAELCQWRDGASRAFTPGWAPATETETVGVPVAAPLELPDTIPVPAPAFAAESAPASVQAA